MVRSTLEAIYEERGMVRACSRPAALLAAALGSAAVVVRTCVCSPARQRDVRKVRAAYGGSEPKCGDCEATGFLKCSTCTGSGEYVEACTQSAGVINYIECMACGGSGDCLCGRCGGRGWSKAGLPGGA